MKKQVVLTAISLLTLLTPLPGLGSTAEQSIALPDIWVYRGHYAAFGGERASLHSSDLEELRTTFLSDTRALRDAEPVDAEHPLTGRLEACDVFVLDGTELYFDDASLPSGGVYGFCDVSVMSGRLEAFDVSSAGGLFVAPDAALTISGEINAGGAVECFGGGIAAGGINAGSVWLDSSEAPLTVTVSDSVFTGFYTQCGGSVTIGGGLYCQLPAARYLGALITVNGEYARYGAASLTVRGDVVAFSDYGGVEVGGGSGIGGYDEAALRVFESERSVRKSAYRGAYDASAPATEVTFIVGGELRSLGGTVFYDGSDGEVR